MWLNVFYLLPLSFLPFGAALISRYDREPVALSLYGFQLLLIALTRLSVWLYATNRPHLLFEPVDRRIRTVGILIAAVPAALYAFAMVVARGAPVTSLVIYAAVPVVYFVGVFVDRSTAPPGSGEDAFT